MSKPDTPTSVPHVLTAINGVMDEVAKSGVGKRQTNTAQNFRYRGVDDVMDALSPLLSRHKLIIVPHVLERLVDVRESRAGGMLLHTVLKIDYDFTSAQDASVIKVGPIYGEAMDSGDKSTNKAMSAAYKYCTTQTFNIPFTADDPDAHTHEVTTSAPAPAPSRATRPEVPKEPSASVQSMSPAPEPQPAGSYARPDVIRPGGIFGYGKKHYETPWNVMRSSDLEWFLNGDRTPQNVREKIMAELSWRDYEADQMEAGRERQRAVDEAATFDDRIP